MTRHPTIPSRASEPNRAYLEAIQKDGTKPPSAHLRPISACRLALDYYHQGRSSEYNPKNNHRNVQREKAPTLALADFRPLTQIDL